MVKRRGDRLDKEAFFQQFVAFTASVHQISADITKDVRSETVTHLQYKILEYVAVRQPLTLSDISECMNMSLPNASRELKKLIEKSLCQKTAAPGDRRKQYIQLTEEGSAMMDEAFRVIRGRFMERISGIPEEEFTAIQQAVRLLQEKVFYQPKKGWPQQ